VARPRPKTDWREQEEEPGIGPQLRAAPSTARDEGVDRLLHETGSQPGQIAERLATADAGARSRVLQRLHDERGNTFVAAVLATVARPMRGNMAATGTGRGQVRRVTVDVARSSGEVAAPVTVQRDGPDGPAVADGSDGAKEAIGPPVRSSYGVTGTTLRDVATAIGGRAEAGRVRWRTSLSFSAPRGRIESVRVTANVTLEMPAWTPPPAMLPRARAEWHRWYSALLAHEQGHIDLVHAHLDGLAAAMLGRRPARGRAMFRAAQSTLARESRRYDASTDHGRSSGTVMDVSIEAAELADERSRRSSEGTSRGNAPQTTEPARAAP
jgi:hypothetical protein